MINLLLILPLLFESVSDGLYLNGYKMWSKQLKVLMVLSWILIWWLVPFTWQGVLIYFLLRAILFNYCHNIAAGLPLNYLGKVSIIDRLVALLSFGQWWLVLLFQAICGVFVYFILTGKI